jgi:hypothetical protein
MSLAETSGELILGATHNIAAEVERLGNTTGDDKGKENRELLA